MYTLEVIDSENSEEPLASFELHNTPIHHPEGRDVALMHLKDEETGERVVPWPYYSAIMFEILKDFQNIQNSTKTY